MYRWCKVHEFSVIIANETLVQNVYHFHHHHYLHTSCCYCYSAPAACLIMPFSQTIECVVMYR